jgi:hypothetical protein
MKRLCGIWIFGTLACFACSSHEREDAKEEYAETALEIGEASCATAPNDSASVAQGFETLTPQTYSNPACFKAWVEGISNFGPARIFAEWAVPPTTRSSCEAAYVRADLYRKVNGTFTKIDQRSANGAWGMAGGAGTASCRIQTSVCASTPAGTYKLVATARTTSATSAPTRKLRLYGGGPGSGTGGANGCGGI